MAAQLPWELEEEILSRLLPESLVRFRIVCKRWNRVCKDNTFQNNHLSRSRPQFVFVTGPNKYFKNYSIDIIKHNSFDPTIELRELPSSPIITHRDFVYSHTTVTTCDELVLFCDERSCHIWTGLVWNPWPIQVKRIFKKEKFDFFGLGYDNSRPEKVYKILGHSRCLEYQGAAIYNCASHALKLIDTPEKKWLLTDTTKVVSMNGNLYWFTRNIETLEYFIQSFDFSAEIFKPFCLLPCQINNPYDQLLLAVFKRDGLSLLKQCHLTKKIEIWVTNKIDKEEAVWIKLMTSTTK